MKIPVFFVFVFFSTFVEAQDFAACLANGKAEFFKPYEEQNFKEAAIWLEKAVNLDSKNAEAHYFLAYAYSRINSLDGSKMPEMSREMALKVSRELETVNRLSPKYEGEIVVLDPYSKLGAEWGALALKYLYANRRDSALWALKQGKKRGGFTDYFEMKAEKTLEICPKNAILFSTGDNNTFPLLYVQHIKKNRPDISIVDAGLIGSLWYPKYISENEKIEFGMDNILRDTIQYITWTDSIITIPLKNDSSFSWTMKSMYYEGFLLRSEILMMKLIETNAFVRPVCFTDGFAQDQLLNLSDVLETKYLIESLEPEKKASDFMLKKQNAENACELVKMYSGNSKDELRHLLGLRITLLLAASEEISSGNYTQADEFLKLIEKKINPERFPFEENEIKTVYEQMKDECREKK